LDGILEGLKAKVASAKAGVDEIQKAVGHAKNFTTDMPWHSYFSAKRDLENLRFIREKIAIRMIQEEIDMAIEKSK
jgi:hypothetical protein